MDKERIIRNTQPASGRALPLTGPNVAPAVMASPAKEVDRDYLRSRFSDELDEIRAQARESGLQAGRQEVAREIEEVHAESARATEREMKRLRAQLDEQTQALEQKRQQLIVVMRELKEHRDALLQDMEPQLVEIALAGVLKILGHAAKDRSLIRRLVATQLAGIPAARPLRIRISSGDFELVKEDKALRDASLLELFVADRSLSPGDCLMETEHGTLDAGLGQQLSRFRETLLAAYGNRTR